MSFAHRFRPVSAAAAGGAAGVAAALGEAALAAKIEGERGNGEKKRVLNGKKGAPSVSMSLENFPLQEPRLLKRSWKSVTTAQPHTGRQTAYLLTTSNSHTLRPHKFKKIMGTESFSFC